MKKVKLNLYIDSEVKQELTTQAADNSRGISEHVKELVCAERRRAIKAIRGLK